MLGTVSGPVLSPPAWPPGERRPWSGLCIASFVLIIVDVLVLMPAWYGMAQITDQRNGAAPLEGWGWDVLLVMATVLVPAVALALAVAGIARCKPRHQRGVVFGVLGLLGAGGWLLLLLSFFLDRA
jgi:hypothetical protein